MCRKLIKFAANLMTDSGIVLLKKDTIPNPIWKLIASLSLFTLAGISTCMVSITNTDDFYTFINPSPYLAAAVVLQGGVYFMFHYRKIIADMLGEMDENIFTYPDEHLLQVQYDWYMEEENVTLLMIAGKYFMFFVLFAICWPVVGELIYYGRIKTFIYPSWTPWKVDNLRAELFKFTFQLSQGVCGIWFAYMIAVFQLVIIVEFMRQYERLIVAVSSLDYRTFVTLQQSKKIQKDYDRVMRQNIINCIKHHQLLHKNFRPFKIWFSIFFSLELATSAITFAFALYVMINASSLGQVLNYFIVVVFIWANLLTRCFVSEIFASMDYSVSETLMWNVEWYRASEGNRRLLLMFNQMACRPLRLFGLSIFEATRVTFTTMTRRIFSIFNVLNLQSEVNITE